MANTLQRAIEKRPKDIKWNWLQLSLNSAITLEFVFAHPEYPWEYSQLIDNPNVPVEFILENMHICNYDYVGQYVSLEYIIVNAHLIIYYWPLISLHDEMTIDFVANNIDQIWDWGIISGHDNINPRDLIDRCFNQCYWPSICANINITDDVINTYSSLMDGERLSRNKFK